MSQIEVKFRSWGQARTGPPGNREISRCAPRPGHSQIAQSRFRVHFLRFRLTYGDHNTVFKSIYDIECQWNRIECLGIFESNNWAPLLS